VADIYLTQGSDPSEVILPVGEWTKIGSYVNVIKMTKTVTDYCLFYWTYVKGGGTAPSGLTGIKFSCTDALFRFIDSLTSRDVYVYPVTIALPVKLEA
jgi:hypothetical protein